MCGPPRRRMRRSRMRMRRRRLSVRLGVCLCLCVCVCEAVSNRCVSSIFNAFDHSLSPLPSHLGSPHPSYPTYPAYPAHSPHAHRDSHSSYLCRLTHKACKDFHNFQGSPGHTAKRRSRQTGRRKEASPRASAPVRIQLAATVIKAIVP